jgi:Ca2+-transporting ATPase
VDKGPPGSAEEDRWGHRHGAPKQEGRRAFDGNTVMSSAPPTAVVPATSPRAPVARPFAMTAEAVAAALDVDPARGLTRQGAEARRRRVGDNELMEVRARSALSIFVHQFKSFLVGLLAVAVVVSAAFGQAVEAGAILAVIILNGGLGFAIELRAVRSVEALRKLGSAHAIVRRDGTGVRVSASELVPGDVVMLEAGDIVSADLRLLDAAKLQVDESTFTGESEPVEKAVEAVDAQARLTDRHCLLFKGTAVTRGTANALVVATGMATELGRISQLVTEAEDEATPLEQRLNKLGQGFVWITLALCGVVLVSGLVAGTALLELLQTLIALAVATVPEGLPVVATIALARGVQRMAKHQALVRRLSAVETLGATSVLCTDKTGTLTENRMTLVELRTAPDEAFTLEGDRYQGDGDREALTAALRALVFCNNASLGGDSELDDGGVGDPMEVALLVAGRREGIEQRPLVDAAPELKEIAFDSETRRMATFHADKEEGGEGVYIAVKGAPETVLPACTEAGEALPAWQEAADAMAARGLRVLAVASKRGPDLDTGVDDGLTPLGLVGLMDPPRSDVVDVLTGCRAAGVRVVMVTGDHPGTAALIAQETGLMQEGDSAALGETLVDGVDGEQARAPTVYARVNPAEKLRLIRAHQQSGAIVAMTGDGVNDAPALKHADIGVAMGERGTEVARQAADLVLQDDRLATVLVAIREGRVIFDNLRNFVIYLLSTNVAEVLVVGLAAAVGGALPLLPLQILFLNLVTDVFPALALGVGEGRDDAMQRPPRPSGEAILGRPQWQATILHGAVLTATALGAFLHASYVLELDVAGARSVVFMTLGFAETLHVFNLRSPHEGFLSNDVTRNRWVWGAVALSLGLVLFAAFFPPLAHILGVSRLPLEAWATVLAMAFAPVLAGQTLLGLGLIDHAASKTAP